MRPTSAHGCSDDGVREGVRVRSDKVVEYVWSASNGPTELLPTTAAKP